MDFKEKKYLIIGIALIVISIPLAYVLELLCGICFIVGIVFIIFYNKQKNKIKNNCNNTNIAIADKIQPSVNITNQPNNKSSYNVPKLGYVFKYSYTDVVISGTKYYDTSFVQKDMSIQFLEEPNNEFDKNAVAVLCDNKKIGYIPNNKLLKMYHDFNNREGYVTAQINLIDTDKIQMAMYYFEPEKGYEDLIKMNIPHKVFKLTGNGNSQMQENISFSSVGDEIFIDYDYDKEKYLVTDSGDIGYLSKSAENILDNDYSAYISDITENDNGKNVVSIAVFSK